jgi:hypothetical protein
MITSTCSLARKLRVVFRRAGNKPGSGLSVPMSLQAGPDGLRIRSMPAEIAVEYHLPEELPVEESL